ncbi:hypothetical protein FOA52_003809 [Chlamydomonas sp. UWO 241]|nr:hypothetical protein FOA52_003809 [Chlamydomonas sp. UWO 241]
MADPSEGGGGPEKVSFGFTKKAGARAKVAVQVAEEGPARVELSALESGGVFRTLDGRDVASLGVPGKKTFIIPKIENTYQAGKQFGGPNQKFTPSWRPPASDAPVHGEGENKFELAAPTAATVTSYGLTHIARKEVKEEPGGDSDDGGGGPSRAGLGGSITQRLAEEKAAKDAKEGRGGRGGGGGRNGRDSGKDAAGEALEQLPDIAPVEAYEDMPIEEFGMAMLRGMGWQEGMGVGRNRKTVEAIEYLKRPERLGLGAQSVLPAKTNKGPRKMGDPTETVRREEMVLAPDADGRQRHVRKLDEKLVHRRELAPGPRFGKDMDIVGGRHEGLKCVVIEVLPKTEGRSERCRVRLRPSDEEDEVRTSPHK